MTEIAVLARRYRRLVRFDRTLCVCYGASALVPIHALVTTGNEPIFHVTGALLIVTVGILGWIVDSRILTTSLRSEAPAYGVTAFLVAGRLALARWGVALVSSTWRDADRLNLTIGPFLRAMLEISTAPPVATLLLFAVLYRVLYHVSVHFLLKMQRLRGVELGSPTNPEA